MKTKKLNKTAMLKNICGLSVGDKAYCGPYGTITCIESAHANPILDSRFCNASNNLRGMYNSYRRNSRKFSVSGSYKIHNGGNYTMKSLREAIGA